MSLSTPDPEALPHIKLIPAVSYSTSVGSTASPHPSGRQVAGRFVRSVVPLAALASTRAYRGGGGGNLGHVWCSCAT